MIYSPPEQTYKYMGDQGVREGFALDKHTTVFQAEVYSILLVINIDVGRWAEENIYIFPKSQMVLEATVQPGQDTPVQKFEDALE